MNSLSFRRMLGVGALAALGLPIAAGAQQDSKSNAMDRAMAAMSVTNSLRGSGNNNVRPLPIGARQSSSLDASDPTLEDGSHVELWALELQAGDQVSVTMRSSDFDTMLLMAQVDNTQFKAENDDFEEGSTDSRLTFRAPANGVYAIFANSFDGGARGNYTIEVTRSAPQAGGGGGLGTMADVLGAGSGSGGAGAGSNALSYGQTVNGELTDTDRTLDDGSKYDEYTFQGNAGDRVVISLSSSAFDTYLALLNAGGTRVAQNDDAAQGSTNSEISFTLPSSGRFTIVANSFEAGSFGSYSLRLEKR